MSLALRILPLSLLVITCAAASGRDLLQSYAVESTVYQLCSEGGSQINSQAYTQAVETFQKAASYDPTSYSAYVHTNMAIAYRQLKNYPQAIANAEVALKYDPSSMEAVYAMANCYYDQGQFSQAKSCLARLLQYSKDPSTKARAQSFVRDISAYADLGEAANYIGKRKNEQALRSLEEAASYDPSQVSAQVHAEMSYVLRQTGQPARSIDEAKRTLQLAPNDKSTMYTMGMAYADLCRFDDASQWIRRYLEVETDPRERDSATMSLKAIADDKAQFNNPANRYPDYLQQCIAQGYSYRWAQWKLPLKVYIASGNGIYGYRSQFKNFVVRALDTWCMSSGKKLNYVLTNNPSNADIKVVWTTAAIPLNDNHPNTLPAGETSPQLEDDKHFSQAVITVRTTDPFDSSRTLEDGECASVIMHEVAHALGIGHSTYIKDVMYFRSSFNQTGMPSSRDKATIARLYEDYPSVQFIPRPEALPTPPRFLPPPAFMPPKPPDTTRITPPLFIPPPIKTGTPTIGPPVFTPPPLHSVPPSGTRQPSGRKDNGSKPSGSPPFFTPPPKY